MMKKDKINALQLTSLVMILLISGFMGTGIYSLIRVASVDGYISIIISMILGLVIVFIFTYIANYEKDLSVRDKINSIFGKKIGFILNLVLVSAFFIMSIVFTYNYNSFISSQFLSETPILFIAIPFTILSFYVVTRGFETLSRVGLIIICINIFLLFVALCGVVNTIDLSNLLPFMKDGIKNPLLGVVYFSLTNIVPIFLFLIIPKNNIINQDKYNKYIVIGYIIAMLLMLGMFIIILGSLGIHLASAYQYPEYIVLKRVELFNFLDRIENIVVVQWLFGIFVSIVLIVYYIANMIKSNTNSKLLYGLILIILMVSSVSIFKNSTLFEEFCYYVMPYVIGSILLVMVILWSGIIIKKKI